MNDAQKLDLVRKGKLSVTGGHRPMVLRLTTAQMRILWRKAYDRPDALNDREFAAFLRCVLPDVLPDEVA